MTYDCLKIIHILCAGMLLTSVGYSYYLWKEMRKSVYSVENFGKIQKQTWLFFAPIALIQTISGFTMISLNHYSMTELWIKASVVSFVIVMGSWFSFTFFLLASQPHPVAPNTSSTFYKRAQWSAFFIFTFALVTMIFFMSTKIGSTS